MAAGAQAQTPSIAADSFYSAFARHDTKTMTDLYVDSNEPIFSDPIFQNLTSREVKGMWQMLVSAGHDLGIQYQIESSDNNTATVYWTADYTYSSTGRHVTNHVRSTLFVQNGKIVNQVDEFDLCAWTTQALGTVKGYMACYFPSSLRSQARATLEQYLKAHGL